MPRISKLEQSSFHSPWGRSFAFSSVVWSAPALLAILLALPRPALASFYTAHTAPGSTLQESFPVESSFSDADRTAMARAGEDLGIFMRARALAPNSLNNNTRDVQAVAQAQYDDLIFTGPTPTVEATLHFTYYAHFSSVREIWTGESGGLINSNTSHHIDALVSLLGGTTRIIRIAINPQLGLIEVTDPDAFTQTIFFSDLDVPLSTVHNGMAYAGFRGVEAFTFALEFTVTAEVPTGVPWFLDVDLNGRTTAIANFLAGTSGTADAYHSLGVPRGVTVVDLPPGYSLNSASLGIVDNVAVPEPSIGVLLAAGIMLLGELRRRGDRPGETNPTRS